jgi:hypothetical protein
MPPIPPQVDATIPNSVHYLIPCNSYELHFFFKVQKQSFGIGIFHLHQLLIKLELFFPSVFFLDEIPEKHYFMLEE